METYFCISTERNSSSLEKLVKYFDTPYKNLSHFLSQNDFLFL